MQSLFKSFLLIAILQCSALVISMAQFPVVISIGSDTVAPGETFCIPIKVINFDSIVGFAFNISWDENELEFVNATDFFTNSYSIGNFGVQQPGKWIATAWNDVGLSGTTLSDYSVLFELCFKAGALPGQTGVSANNDFMVPSVAASFDYFNGQNLWNESVHIPGTITIIGGPSAASETDIDPTLVAIPNPFSDRFSLKGLSAPAQVRIFDALGQPVFEQTIVDSTTEIVAGHLAAGTYFWQTIDTNNGQLRTGKLMKL